MEKTALITGAGKGIGRALSLKLALEGYKLGLVSRTANDLVSLSQELDSLGCKHYFTVGSIADNSTVETFVNTGLEQFGQIGFLVNNAGVGAFGSTENITEEIWDKTFDINTKAIFLTCKALIPQFKKQQFGHIINIASDVAKRTFEGGSLYCASKFAVDAFSSALRKELRKHKTKVSVVYSGLVDTHFHSSEQGSEKHADYLAAEEMANSIYFVMNQPKNVVIGELMIHPLSQEY
jgi:NADP-dependent 3-hydroxy acid dehydrogenase YdfG